MNEVSVLGIRCFLSELTQLVVFCQSSSDIGELQSKAKLLSGLSAEDSFHLSWLKPLGRRPCREIGPPQSLQLGFGATPVHGMWPHGKPVSETCSRLVVESLWLQ